MTNDDHKTDDAEAHGAKRSWDDTGETLDEPGFPSAPPYADNPLSPSAGDEATHPHDDAPAVEEATSTTASTTSTPAATPKSRSNSRKYWIAGLAVLAVIAVAGGLVINAFRSKIGAKTPDEAIERFVEAGVDQDWLSMGLMIEPTERDQIFRRYSEIGDELERLELLDSYEDAFNFDAFESAVTMKVENLETSVERVNDDIYRGWIDNAEITGSYDFSENLEIAEALGVGETGEFDETIDTRADNFPIGLVERDGRWYVSMWYTLAENLREEQGKPPPDPSQRLVSIGSDNPEAAATLLTETAADLNIAQFVALLDPTESGALVDYWSLYGESLEEFSDFVDESVAEVVDISVRDLEWDVDKDGDYAGVALRKGTMEIRVGGGELIEEEVVDLVIVMDRDAKRITVDGSIENEPFGMEIEWSESSLTLSGGLGATSFEGQLKWTNDRFELDATAEGETVDIEGRVEGECLVITGQAADEAVDEVICDPSYARTWDVVNGDNAFEAPRLQFHKNDGKWYFSPTRTSMDVLIGNLKSYEPEDFDLLRRNLERGALSEPETFFEDPESFFAESDPSLNQDPIGEEGLEDVLTADELRQAEPVAVPYYGTIADGEGGLIVVDLEEPATILVGSNSFDTTMVVYDLESGELVAYNDDLSAETTDSAVTIPEPGAYVIRIDSFLGISDGEYIVITEPN